MYEFDPAWIEKLTQMRAEGREPYPNGFRVTHLSTELHAKAQGVEDLDSLGLGDVCVAGRVRFRNRMGKAMFLRIQDRGEPSVPSTDNEGMLGGAIQVYLRREEVGDDAFAAIKGCDIGDFVWVKGFLMRTKTGELSVQAKEIALAGKIMQPFPDRWHGMTDTETRSRQRYVDLFMNESTRETFRRRSAILRYLRDFFWARDFMEVETPMMQPIPGGANARPFKTHHNALDMQLFLRIAPELYLKRLVVGGFERVYEINRNFRNEGLSPQHNPEFTMLEFYQAYADYGDLMDMTEELLARLAVEVTGGTSVAYQGTTLEFGGPFRRVTMREAVAAALGVAEESLEDPSVLIGPVRKAGIEADKLAEGDALLAQAFEELVEPTLMQPTFVTRFPRVVSPLARASDDDPRFVDRFELFIAGREIANGFSELNDPEDQRERFLSQLEAREAGDEEAHMLDEDYVRALEFGMPPTAGEGIGVDRLAMLLTDAASIRDVILFPHLRHEGGR